MPVERHREKLHRMTEEIHFVTGKGGTGKSVLAAGLALREARRGRKTLLVELGERSFYKDFFSLPAVDYHPTPFLEHLDVARWNGMDCLREYATSLVKVERLTKIFFENAVSRSLIEVAPALTELAILGKITSGPRKYGPAVPHEVIVVDAYATGHFLALLQAPSGMASAIRFGPMGEQSRSIDAAIRDPKLCKTHVACLPEEMPVQETEELVAALRKDFSLDPDIFLNKMLAVPAAAAGVDHPFARFLVGTDERQKAMRARLDRLKTRVCDVPFIFDEEPLAMQKLVAEALS